MKVITNILKFIIMIILVLCIIFVGNKNIAFSTIFNKQYIVKKLEATNFYSKTYKLVEESFENYIGQSGLDEEVLQNICTEDKVRKDVNIILSNIYDGKQEEIDTTEIADKLNSNIDAQNVRNSKNSSAIDEFVNHICQSYKDTIISTKYDKTINDKYNTIIKKITQIEKIVIVGMIISCICLIVLNIKNIKKILLNIQTILVSTAIIQFVLTGTIKNNINISGIKVFNEAFSNSIITIIKDILSQINKFGLIILAIYVIFAIIYIGTEIFEKKDETKIEE